MRYLALLTTLLLSQQPTAPTPAELKARIDEVVRQLQEMSAQLEVQERVVVVSNSEQLQHALNTAVPGTTIALARGEYLGNFTVRRGLNAQDGPPISLVTHQYTLPVARPETWDGMATLRSPSAAAVLTFEPGAGNFQVIGVGFAANKDGAGDIVSINGVGADIAALPHHITFDRVVMKGGASGQKRAMALNGTEITVTNSRFENIWKLGQDSQCWAIFSTPGRIIIKGNWCEAASENLLIGGDQPASAEFLPCDIEVYDNVFTKNRAWRTTSTTEVVKNLFEVKYGCRINVVGNLLDGNWRDGQSGYAVLFTVQTGLKGVPGCPVCAIRDVVFANNIIRNVAAGVSILGSSYSSVSGILDGLVIRNNRWEIDGTSWGGNGFFISMSGGPKNVTVSNNTVINNGSSFINVSLGSVWPVGSATAIPAPVPENFVVTGNVFIHESYFSTNTTN